ncbi:iron transporter [Herminiimonas sp. KBW02]|uniref:iron transporter n=1 Tax=Herminiimonas sp. KBW02 TaxID=2153363 RepID=UPI001F236BEB|nr:iron transporter [Herminiimonas sp. KBW02]
MRAKPIPTVSPSYRWMIASRVLAASVGAYVLSALSASVLALLLPLIAGVSRAEGVLTGTLLSFVIYTCIALWVFCCRSAMRVWMWLIAWSAGLALLLYFLQG